VGTRASKQDLKEKLRKITTMREDLTRMPKWGTPSVNQRAKNIKFFKIFLIPDHQVFWDGWTIFYVDGGNF